MLTSSPREAYRAGRNTFFGKGLAAVLLVAVLALSCFVIMNNSDESSADTSGTCGANLNWEYDGDTHTLTITGTGEMSNYNPYPPQPPWYSFRTDIVNLTISSGVTSIGNYAFSGCSSLKSVSLPNTLSVIGSSSFASCSKLASIVIPNSVTTLKYEAFYGCSNLCSVTLGSSVEEIATTSINSSFHNCYHLVEVINLSSLPLVKGSDTYGEVAKFAILLSSSGTSALKTQDDFAYMEFNGRTNLLGYLGDNAAIALPDKLNGKDYYIHDYAFYNKSTITSVTFGTGVKAIGANAFYGCSGLTGLTIPGTVEKIGDNAFDHCSGLTEITLENGIKSIGNMAFQSCSKLATISLPASVSSIGELVFNSCSKLEAISVDPSNAKYSSDEGVLYDKGKTELIKYPQMKSGTSFTIPNTVKTIDRNAFASAASLTSIDIPDSVVTVGEKAFLGCSGITEVNIGKGVQSLGTLVFSSCSSLESITVDPSNTKYCSDGGVLYDKGKTVLIKYPQMKTGTSYTAPNTLTTISDEAFYRNTSLTSVTLTSSVESIGINAFNGCTNLAQVIGGTGVKTIGGSAFYNLTKLTTISLGSVVSIGNYAFQSTGISGIVDLSSAEVIGSSSFNGCTGITDVRLPAIISMDNHAFLNCSSLKTVTFGNKLTSMGQSVFQNCTSLTSVSIPDSLEILNINDFQGCSSLAEVYIGDGVKTIKDNVFWNCAITYIYIGNGVETITDSPNPFRDMTFYDSDGTTVLDKTPEALRGMPFMKIDGKLRKVSGICGDNVNWSVDSKGILAIAGTGAMATLETADDQPWSYLRNEITGLTVTDGITAISNHAFANCSNLGSVTLPDSITSIGQYAFNCTGITELTIPAGVTAISDNAFRQCEELVTLIIPGNVTSIGNFAFNSCTKLENLTISDSVTEVGNAAFAGCNVLKRIYFGSGLTTVPSNIVSQTLYESDETIEIEKTANNLRGAMFGYYGSKLLKENVDVVTDGDTSSMGSATDSASVSQKDIIYVKQRAASNPDAKLQLNLADGKSATFDAKAIGVLADAATELSIATVDKATLTDEEKALVGDNPVFEIDFGSNTDFGDGKATFTVPFTLPDGKSASNMRVYYVSGGALAETIPCTYADGKVTFDTNHLSMYMIGFESPSGSSGEFPILIVAVIAVVAVAGVGAFFFISKKKQA